MLKVKSLHRKRERETKRGLVSRAATMGRGRGPNTADSYIGSLISLTSKSEIRYEGILYTVDTENSNIALQNGAMTLSTPTDLRPLSECFDILAWVEWPSAVVEMVS